MLIQICGQAEAVRLASEARTGTSIISITSKEDGDVVFTDNPNVLSVLRLKFNDLYREYDDEGFPYGRPLPVSEDFEGLRDFPLPVSEDFEGLRDFVEGLACDDLIVHCWEGASRSAAVAKAVYEFRGKTDELKANREISPNPLVYALACGELGIW